MFKIARDYEEKRDFIRMSLTSHLSFQKLTSLPTHHQGITHNLSGKGVSFETASRLKVEEELLITISPNATEYSPLQAKAQVIRIDSLSEDTYLVACKILEVC